MYDGLTVIGELKIGKSKAGKEYTYIELQITPTYSKRIFLENSELELLKLTFSTKKENK